MKKLLFLLPILLGIFACEALPQSSQGVTSIVNATLTAIAQNNTQVAAPPMTFTPIPTQAQSTATQQVTPGEKNLTLSLDILRSGVYRSPDWGEFQLSGGIYYRTPPTSQESPEIYTTRLLDTVLYGDLNLDGFEDAIVFLSTQNGGTGHFIEMAAMLNLSGSTRNISTLYLGDRVVVESGTIRDGLITLNLRVQGPNDGACCPSQLATWNFRLDSGQLVRISTETIENTPAPTPQPTMLPSQVNNFYGIPDDSPQWLIIPIGRDDNKTPFNILVSGTDANCTITINTKTDFTGLSEQKTAIMLGPHMWNILKTYQGDQQIDEIYYPDIYPQEFREGGGIDGNGYIITGFYDSCRSSIQEMLSRMP